MGKVSGSEGGCDAQGDRQRVPVTGWSHAVSRLPRRGPERRVRTDWRHAARPGDLRNLRWVLAERAPDEPLAEMINSMPKYVASRTLREPLEWETAHLLKGDVAEAVTELKGENGKDLQVIGSGELVQTLMQHDLDDEYRFMIHPVVIGSGKRLFRDGNPRRPLRLVDDKASSTRVLILTYEPADR